jgi:hypothetical protein
VRNPGHWPANCTNDPDGHPGGVRACREQHPG